MRAGKAICISAVLFLSSYLGNAPSSASELKRIQDATTGIRVSLPLDILTVESDGSVGKNWSTADRRFKVSTVQFPPEQTLESAYQKLSTIKGRKLSHSER